MRIEIDQQAGFCFGVKRAIHMAEQALEQGQVLYSLGEMVHNREEVERLRQKGMSTIEHQSLGGLSGKTVLFRSHGEPPQSYKTAGEHDINLIDATCPVVLKLQERIKNSYEALKPSNGQVIIYGKKDHPETIGLVGQTNGTALVFSSVGDLDQIDFSRPLELFSQTTMSLDGFRILADQIKAQAQNKVHIHDTICRQVANRLPHMAEFSVQFDRVLFVSGKNSSNGKMLFHECLKHNPLTYQISAPAEIDPEWLSGAGSVGITGATSTPLWLLEQVRDRLTQILNISQ